MKSEIERWVGKLKCWIVVWRVVLFALVTGVLLYLLMAIHTLYLFVVAFDAN